jgi:hypothetical protein
MEYDSDYKREAKSNGYG